MENFEKTYNMVWVIVAITGSLALLLFKNQFLNKSKKIYLLFHKKTNISLFGRVAEEFSMSYMNFLVTILGLLFMVVGVIILVQNVR